MRQCISWFLALLLTLVLLLLALCTPFDRLLTDEQLLSAAISDAGAVDVMGESILASLDDISEQYQITPDVLRDQVSREAVTVYASQVGEWFSMLLQGDVKDLPTFDTASLEDAVLHDPLYQENHPETQLRTIARDQVGWQVKRVVSREVFPLRASILVLGADRLWSSETISPWLHRIGWLPAVLAGVSLLFLGLLCLIGKPHREGLRWFAAAMIAAVLLLCAGLVLIHLFIHPEGNAVLLSQLRLLATRLAHTLLLTMLCMCVLACVMIHLGRRDRA